MSNYNQSTLAQRVSILQCPVCQSQLRLDHLWLVCSQGHTFDVAKSGYVNFLTKPVHSQYDQSLFKARRRLAYSDFFRPLVRTLAQVICQQALSRSSKSITILDSGCGEGTILNQVYELINQQLIGCLAVGLDIAKSGIQAASRSYPEIVWLVANLAQCPLRSGSVDVVLNTLSPANYQEFKRVLKPNGWLVKTIPGPHYLLELRQLVGKQPYDNARVTSLFQTHFDLVDEKRVLSAVKLDQNQRADLLVMTPLGWHTSTVSGFLSGNVTLDLRILVGPARV